MITAAALAPIPTAAEYQNENNTGKKPAQRTAGELVDMRQTGVVVVARRLVEPHDVAIQGRGQRRRRPVVVC